MAITTENTYLIYNSATSGSTASWKKVVDVKEIPDLGSAPSTVEVTTLSDHQKVYLPGLVDTGNFEFSANYDKDDFEALKKLEGTEYTYGVQLGKSGGDGVYTFKGSLTTWIKGGGTESSLDIAVNITVASEPTADSTAKVEIK